MKSSLLFTTMTLLLAAPGGFAKSELETLRTLCAEQERQIRQLEQENSNLRSDQHETPAFKPKSEVNSAVKPSALATETTYIVKAGDSIDKIGRKVGMTPEQLAKANGLKPNAIIQPGQKLKITGRSESTTVAAVKPAESPVSAPTTHRAKGEEKTHTVQQGETYFSISKKYKVSTEALIAANPSVKASAMRPGQVIKITGGNSTTMTISAPAAPQSKAPAEKSTISATKTSEAKPSTHAAATPAVTKSAPPETKVAETPAPAPAPVVENVPAESTHEKKFRSVTIDNQTTYGEFATKHGTDAERLNALNGLDLTTATVLAKGSELYVPATP